MGQRIAGVCCSRPRRGREHTKELGLTKFPQMARGFFPWREILPEWLWAAAGKAAPDRYPVGRNAGEGAGGGPDRSSAVRAAGG